MEKLLEVLGMFLMLFAVLGVHELGHLLVGMYQGFRFEMFVVGPLGIKREDGVVKVYLNKNLEYYGGLALTIPVEDDPSNSKKFANLILAGPIVSLIFALVMALLAYLLDGYVAKVAIVGAWASIGIFFATTLPSKTGSFFTDRKRYQRLISNGIERDVELALLRVIAAYGKDNSYVNIREEDIELIIGDPDYKFMGLFTKLYYQYEKTGKFDPETKSQYDLVAEKSSKSLVKAFAIELDKIQK